MLTDNRFVLEIVAMIARSAVWTEFNKGVRIGSTFETGGCIGLAVSEKAVCGVGA